MKRFYIAYGSNLNIPQMEARCPGATIKGTAILKGWELFFKGSKTGSYLTIERKQDGRVPVAIWEVTPADEDRLDLYEGFPRFYYKQGMKLNCRSIKTGEVEEIEAFVYIMHEDRLLGIPSRYYMEVCEEGYEYFGFNKRYLIEAYGRSLRKEAS